MEEIIINQEKQIEILKESMEMSKEQYENKKKLNVDSNVSTINEPPKIDKEIKSNIEYLNEMLQTFNSSESTTVLLPEFENLHIRIQQLLEERNYYKNQYIEIKSTAFEEVLLYLIK